MKKFYILLVVLLVGTFCWAGNPDRQGEAGAYELLMNPWARSAGLHTMSTANIVGLEAMRLNVAGISRINSFEANVSYANYLQGTDISMNSVGVASRVGKSGAIAFSLMTLDFGDIEITTVDQPEGTGTSFSPNFFNLGIGYGHTFENKVSVGIALRVVSEAISDISAFGFAIDAGVQYVTGENDNFKFGISLRNVGSPMRFTGEGLGVASPSPNNGSFELTLNQRSATYELPSMLNIGMSYDFLFANIHRLTVLGNFTSNSFSQDQLGAGVEYSLNELFMLRGAYKVDLGNVDETEEPIYTGLAAGASIAFPINKENKNTRIALDYAYRNTKVWQGTHNIGLRISL
ncbi:MAG: PorV/PorQ family protein [Bacteroidota bacterium]